MVDCLTLVTHRNKKRGQTEDDEPTFNQIMLMIMNQQMNEMREHAADCEDERDKRRLCLEEQKEECCMQLGMHNNS